MVYKLQGQDHSSLPHNPGLQHCALPLPLAWHPEFTARDRCLEECCTLGWPSTGVNHRSQNSILGNPAGAMTLEHLSLTSKCWTPGEARKGWEEISIGTLMCEHLFSLPSGVTAVEPRIRQTRLQNLPTAKFHLRNLPSPHSKAIEL